MTDGGCPIQGGAPPCRREYAQFASALPRAGLVYDRPTMSAHRNDQGFSVMELVVVLAVLGILLMLAIPSYLDRTTREQIKAAIPLADIAKKPIAAAWSAGVDLPADNASAGLPSPDRVVSNLVSALRVDKGAIHLTFGNQAHGAIAGKILTLRPAVVEDTPIVPVTWICAGARVPDKMTAIGADLTDVDIRLLPFECKG
jgi:type IV pilus assembly protein PilA